MDESAWKISEIVTDLKERAAETGITRLSTPQATQVLESVGLLYLDEFRQRRPTHYGKLLGIFEERRISQTGEEYTQVLYNDAARFIVDKILCAFKGYAAEKIYYNPGTPAAPIAAAPEKPSVRVIETDSHGASRSNYSVRIRNHPDKIIVFAFDDTCRTFEDSAVKIGQMLGVDVYRNSAGEVGIQFQRGLLDYIESISDNNEPPTEDIPTNAPVRIRPPRTVAAPPATALPLPVRRHAGPMIEYGSRFKLEGIEEEFYIFSQIRTESILRSDGTTEIVNVPVLNINDNVNIITPDSAFARECIGKFAGDTVDFDGYELEIEKVK